MTYSNDQLIQSTKDGNFLEIINDWYQHYNGEQKALSKQLALLHNDGSINLITEFSKLNNDGKREFFSVRHILEDALPSINSSVLEVMQCVKYLTTEAGNDMAAGMLYSPFTQFCEASLDRPENVLTLAINSSNEELFDFIAPALRAGANLNLSRFVRKAIELTDHNNLKIRARAVYALGNINYESNLSLINDVIESLKTVIRVEYDSQVYQSVVKSSFYLYLADESKEQEVCELIVSALVEKNEYEVHAASELLFRETKKLPNSILNILLEALQNTNPKNTGTIDNIDYGLQYLVKANQIEKVLPLLEHLIVNNKDEILITQFDSLTYAVLENKNLLNSLVTKWLLSKKIALCKAVFDLINSVHGNDIGLSADLNILDGHTNEVFFLVRKAIGWLFTKPVSTASFIVSLIEQASDEEQSEIAQLLFHPLLISYPGSSKQYLLDISPELSQKSQVIISKALETLGNYHDGLNAAKDIPELWPKHSQRETHFRHFSRQMSDAHKEAQKHSIFGKLVKNSVLLYGNKSINYIQGPENKQTRQEIPLQKISHSIEFPSLENIDPHSLDYMLRTFRVEGCL